MENNAVLGNKLTMTPYEMEDTDEVLQMKHEKIMKRVQKLYNELVEEDKKMRLIHFWRLELFSINCQKKKGLEKIMAVTVHDI